MISSDLCNGLHTGQDMPRDFFIVEMYIHIEGKRRPHAEIKKRLFSNEYGSVAIREIPEYEISWLSGWHSVDRQIRVVIGFKNEVDKLKFMISYDGVKSLNMLKESRDTYTVVIKG